MLKKMLAFMLCIFMMPFAFVYGEDADTKLSKYEKAFYRTNALEMLGKCSDDFDFSSKVTRAEAAMLAMGLAGFDYSSMQNVKSEFSDVPDDYWAKDAIMAARSLSIVGGMGNGTFMPDAYVTYEQAMKMMVSALNYEALAIQKGGYPIGYLSVASALGLLKNVQISGEEFATKGEMVLILDNALSVRPMQAIYSNGQVEYILDTSKKTKLESLLEDKDIKNTKAVVNATYYTSLVESVTVSYNMVRIGQDVYEVGDSDVYSYLGCEVDAYAKSEDNGNTYTITHVRISDSRNNLLEIEAENIQEISKEKVKYERSNDQRNDEESIDTVNGVFIYNGKKVLPDEIDLQVYNGRIRLIDNNNDDLYDVVLLEDYQSFIVEKVQNSTFYFDDNQTFRGSRGLKIVLDDKNYFYKFVDSDGNALQWEDVEAGHTISVFASLDLHIVKIMVSDKLVSGSITSINNEEKGVVDIDDNTYFITKDETGAPKFNARVGDVADYSLDAMGDVVGVRGDIYTSSHYAYIIGAQATSSLEGKISIKVLSDSIRNKVVEVKNDTEKVSYDFNNTETKVLSFTNKAKITLDNITKNLSDLNVTTLKNKVIKYTLNADNSISKAEITTVPISNVTYSFNAKIMSFAGLLGDDGFLADETTDVFCIPNNVKTEKDYYETVTLGNKSRIMALGVDIDSETQVAGTILIFDDMNSSEAKPIKPDTKVSVVSEVSFMLNEDGEQEYALSVLTGDKIEKRTVTEGSLLSGIVKTLSKGDLIRYNVESMGRITNIEKVGSMNELKRYQRVDENSPSEKAYGIVYRVAYNKLSFIRNDMVDKITVAFSKDGLGEKAYYDILKEDGPYIYVFEKNRGLIRPGDMEEMQSFEEVSSAATEVLLYVNDNDPIAVIIIKNE